MPLFDGYVFCSFGFDDRLQILGSPGVRSMVSFGQGPHPVPEHEIRAILAIASSRLPVSPWPYLRIGQKVKVMKGCLTDVVGTLVREKDVYRVVVSVEMLERSIAVEVDRDVIAPVASARS